MDTLRVDILDFYRARHEGEIRSMDEHLGRLLGHIDRSGDPDESLLFLTADHEEILGEHNCFFTHGENLHNSLLHVPLRVRRGDRYGAPSSPWFSTSISCPRSST